MPVLGTQVIKSIQRGSTTGSGTTTINAVDLSKSFVSASFANGYGRGQQDLSGGGTYAMCALANGAALASTTSITIAQGTFASSQSTASANATCYWEVIEYV